MATEYKNVKGKYETLEANLVLLAKQRGYGADTRRLVQMEADGVTKRYYWDSTRLADTGTTYGSKLIGTPGITGITPDGGSSGAAATLQAMLTGLANKIGSVVAGTIGNYSKFTAADTLGDGLLVESGNTVILPVSVNGTVLMSVQNGTDGASALAGYNMSANSEGSTLFAAPAGYTDEAACARRVNLATSTAINGINIIARGVAQTVRTYFGATAGAGTLFHTLSNKGMKLENIVLSTDADGTIAGIDHAFSVTKNDSNTRAFYGHKILATLNAGGSNANTTLDLLCLDTVDTDDTGMTVNLLSLRYNGSPMWSVDKNGIMKMANSALESTGSDVATITNAPALAAANPYKWVTIEASDGVLCYFPIFRKSGG